MSEKHLFFVNVCTFHMLDRCFPKRFVLDSRQMFRMCQPPSGESSQLVTIKFSRVKERGDLDSVSGTRRYYRLLTSNNNKPTPGKFVWAFLLRTRISLWGYKKPSNNLSEKRASTVCPILYLKKISLSPACVICVGRFLVYFLEEQPRTPNNVEKRTYAEITLIFVSNCFRINKVISL